MKWNLCTIAIVCLGSWKRAFAPADAFDSVWVPARKDESYHAANVMANDINGLHDAEIIEERDHVVGHGGLAEVRDRFRRAACTAVVWSDASVAFAHKQRYCMSELIRSLWESVE